MQVDLNLIGKYLIKNPNLFRFAVVWHCYRWYGIVVIKENDHLTQPHTDMSYYKRVQNGKQVIERLKSGEERFTVKGFDKTLQMNVPKEDDVCQTYAVYDVLGFLSGMNVEEFGATQMKLYTYDLFANKTTKVIKYEDIEFVQEDA